jgi:hypothetical protein
LQLLARASCGVLPHCRRRAPVVMLCRGEVMSFVVVGVVFDGVNVARQKKSTMIHSSEVPTATPKCVTRRCCRCGARNGPFSTFGDSLGVGSSEYKNGCDSVFSGIFANCRSSLRKCFFILNSKLPGNRFRETCCRTYIDAFLFRLKFVLVAPMLRMIKCLCAHWAETLPVTETRFALIDNHFMEATDKSLIHLIQ